MTAVAASIRTFHLLEPDRGLDLPVPAGVSGLDGPAERPRLARGPAGLALEPLRRGNEDLLLLLALDERRAARVNGAPATRVAALRERDAVQVGDWTFHVALHVTSVIGRAPEGYARRPCPVCTQPLGDASVYLCACGTAVHCDRSGDAGAFNCLLGSECPTCRAPVHGDGFTWRPED